MPDASLIKRLFSGGVLLVLLVLRGRLHIDLKNLLGKTSREFEFYAKFWVYRSNFTGEKFF